MWPVKTWGWYITRVISDYLWLYLKWTLFSMLCICRCSKTICHFLYSQQLSHLVTSWGRNCIPVDCISVLRLVVSLLDKKKKIWMPPNLYRYFIHFWEIINACKQHGGGITLSYLCLNDNSNRVMSRQGRKVLQFKCAQTYKSQTY